MPQYKMCFEVCDEIFPGDRRWENVTLTFEASSDAEANQKAAEIADREGASSFSLEEFRDVRNSSE